MLRVAKQDNATVLSRIRRGEIDAVALSTSSLVDEIVLAMHKRSVLSCLSQGFPDKRATNTTVPFDLVLALAISAKMRVHTSLSDIPFALTDHKTICELGYSLVGEDLNEWLMAEGMIRHLIGKFIHQDFFHNYNSTTQNHISLNNAGYETKGMKP